MIGHYLLTLTPDQEDRVLLEAFAPYDKPQWVEHSGLHKAILDTTHRCLVDVVLKRQAGETQGADLGDWNEHSRQLVGASYDHAARRFGTPRVNAAIRNRILANRARRILTQRTMATA